MSGHKADSTFFEEKKPWSRRKDVILEHYLVPYLPKVFKLGKPVLIVDGFAGPGRFDDGENGSPRMIASFIERSQLYSKPQPVELWCIEKNKILFNKLVQNTSEYVTFTRHFHADFADKISDIEQRVRTHTIFLYLDPFTNAGLNWKDLDRVFQAVGNSNCIEVLLNFNVVAFARVACASLQKRFTDAAEYESADDDLVIRHFNPQSLDLIMGSDTWRGPFLSSRSFPEACDSINRAYMSLLRSRFKEVCAQQIKAIYSHKTPKYLLIYGSRSPEGLRVMNDAMAKARQEQALYEEELIAEREGPGLWLRASPGLIADTHNRLPNIIMDVIGSDKVRRSDLQIAVFRRAGIGEYSRSDVNNKIAELIKSKRLQSADGKTRLNDDSMIFRSPR
jgi:three-Cys-motif partner protein